MNNKERIAVLLERLPLLYPGAGCLLDFDGDPEKLLIATILSARTTDRSVNEVTPRLWDEVHDINGLAKAEQKRIEDIVHSLGFYRSKARSIRSAAAWLLENNGLPETIEELVQIPGVGRKTANVIIGVAFSRPAIIVDTHVGRLSGRLDLTRKKQPDKIEFKLRKLLPEDRWTSFSNQLGFHGRQVCTSRSPSCPSCGLSGICPRKGV